jgi:uroporphyrinogen-III synthase
LLKTRSIEGPLRDRSMAGNTGTECKQLPGAMTLPILITRPQPGADRLAAALKGRLGSNARIVVSPLMRIETIDDALADLSRFQAFALTSAHAVAPLAKALGERTMVGKTAYCVGRATARAAEAAGFEAVDGGGDAKHLAGCILASPPAGPLLYVRGEHVASDLAELLASAGVEACEAVVYRQVDLAPNARATELLGGNTTVVLPLFSPRSASLALGSGRVSAPLRIIAMSQTVAEMVPDTIACEVIIAPRPTLETMIEMIVALASASNPVESDEGPQ